MSSKASLLASLTGGEDDDTSPPPPPLPPTTTTTTGEEEEGLSSIPIHNPSNTTNNQTENDVVAEGSALFGVGTGTNEEEEEEEADLFGSIPTPGKKDTSGGRPSSSGRALLAGSGLMGDLATDAASSAAASSASGGNGDGLFDEVDAEAERERLRLEKEEERQRQLRAQQEREEKERLAAAKAAQAERERVEALERERMAALKLQQEQEAAAAAAAEAAARAQMSDMSLNGRMMQNQEGMMGNQQDVFYRPDVSSQYNNPLAQQPPQQQQPQQQPINAGYGASSYYYSTSGQTTHAQSHQQQQPQQQPSSYQPPHPPPSQPPPPPAPLMHGRYHHQQLSSTAAAPPAAASASVAPSTISSVTAPSLLAGMHVGHNPNVGGVIPTAPPSSNTPAASNNNNNNNTAPPPIPAFQPFYGLVTVSDPILVQGSGLFAGPPHWTYGITVRMNQGSGGGNGGNGNGAIVVRRRFRHFVALEDRLRVACPGAILPPRPDKHAARAIEEASTRQSAQFALQRASELETYLNALINHPIVGSSDVLRLFLTLQDHIGVAWPEVSSSAITRLSTFSDKAATKLADGAGGVMQDLGVAQQQAAGEDNAEILALVASEGVRIGAVSQAVPKMEGTVALIRDQADRCGVVGLELSKLAKDVQGSHAELAVPLDLLSSALLRTGRRGKRLAVELSAAMVPFSMQYKLCRYERMAFADRRAALAKRTVARQKADARATKLHLHQSSLQTRHNIPALERMEMEAAMGDEVAGEAVREADKVGATLLEEIKRVSGTRGEEWRGSVKVLASSMKEACAEKVSIWESVREQFEVEFPDMAVASPPPAAAGNLPVPSAPPQSESSKSGGDVPNNVMVDNGQMSSGVSYSTSTTGVPSAVQG